MTMENKPTAGAQRAIGLAQLVNKVFAHERVASTLDGHAGYRVEMVGPEALSTSARQGALDQLKLVPVDAARAGTGEGSRATLLIGSADPSLSQVELRTFDRLAQLHSERYQGASLPLDAASYDALRGKIQRFFEDQGIAMTSAVKRNDHSLSPSPASRRSPVLALVTVAAVILIALAVVALRLR
jgi:hypothetical protein